MFTKTTYKFSLIAVLIALSATEMIEEAVWQDSEWLKSNLEELDNYLIRDIPSQVGKHQKNNLGFLFLTVITGLTLSHYARLSL